MSSEAYQQFLKSMIMDFDKWHDGTGYDLKALGRLESEERDSIEEQLIRNLRDAGDWRDVKALAALGSPSAHAAVDKARYHKNMKVRNCALRIALNNQNSKNTTKKEIAELEKQVIRAVKQGSYKMAEYMPTNRVKKALLNSTLEHTDKVVRVNAAAFLMYLCGQTSEPFDWNLRSFFLRFGESPATLQQAWEELRKRTGL